MRRRAVLRFTTVAARAGALRTGTGVLEGSKKVLAASLLAAMVASSLLLLLAGPTRASTTYVVTNTADPGDGDCNPNGCTLREAINAANDAPGKDAIHFHIAGGGVQTIKPKSELPHITEAVTINGYTQTGTSKNSLAAGTNAVLRIELNGENAGDDADGLTISTSNSVVTGLVINRFGPDDGSDDRGRGIVIRGSCTVHPANNRVVGNFIGTDPSGTLDYPSGTQDFGNSVGVLIYGVSDGTSNNIIGGFRPEPRNLISGNNAAGVEIAQEATDNAVVGNLIGTKKDGTTALGNGGDGVRITGGGAIDGIGASHNLIGGDSAAGGANTIAFNNGDGVNITGAYPIRNRILRNSIFANEELGIDLGDDGPTPNDPDDPDTGPNDLQNTPSIASATNLGDTTTVQGTLDSTANQTIMLRFFRNPSNTNQGMKFIGQKSITTDANGDADFSFTPAQKVLVGLAITATATDPDGNTSEFSAPGVVTRAR